MAAEFRTESGIILPSSAVELSTKADRSQQAMVRTLGGWWGGGGGPSKHALDFLSAIRIPWVYRAVMTISSSFASADWDEMEDGEAIEDPADDFLQLMERPNPFQTGFHFRELSMVYMELMGENFISLEDQDARGRPRELYVLNPAFMYVQPDPKNYVARYYYRPFGPGSLGIPYEPNEIIHMKLPNPKNPYRGFGPVEASAVVLDIVEAMNLHELSYYRSGGRIVGVLETENEVSDDDFERIKKEWQEFSADKAQRLKTAILEAGLKYTPIAEGMRQIDATAINKEKRDAILAVWGVPLTKVGILENAQYKASDADRTFESETMMPKKRRWEYDIQPLVNRFNPARYVEYERKDFDDDSTKLGNARIMAQLYSFTVNNLLEYLGRPPIGPGGDIIWAPSQMVPTPVDRLEELSGAYAEETINPPEPPAPAAVPMLPEATSTGPGSNNGQTGSGARPAGTTNQPSPRVEELRKALADIIERTDDDSVQAANTIAMDINRIKEVEQLLTQRFARRKAVTISGRKAVRKVSSRHPATSTAMTMFLARFLNRAKEISIPEIKRAFRTQRRKLVQPQVIADLAKAGSRKEIIKTLERIMPRQPLEEAVRGLHVSALVQGFHDGAKVLPPQHRSLLEQKLQTRKEARGIDTKQALPDYIAPDAADWRRVAEEWRGGQFPFLESSFDKLADRVTGIDDTTRSSLADAVEEGLRRGYSPMQIANGYDQEGYRGIAGVMDHAEDWRSEMIARTEAGDAFRAGSLASFATAEVPAVEAVDGDEFDEFCRLRDGTIYPLAP